MSYYDEYDEYEEYDEVDEEEQENTETSIQGQTMANETYKRIESGIACIADNVQSEEDDEWN